MTSYGDAGGIAALTPRFADVSGVFTTTTRPTLAHVDELIVQVSAVVDTILARHGFCIPVDNVTMLSSLEFFVNEQVASIVEGINGSGRFGPTAKQPHRKGRHALIMEDVSSYIEMNEIGFERMGACRNETNIEGIGYRQLDNSGDLVTPLFQRKGHGNTVRDWD